MTRAQMQARRTGQSISRDMTLMQTASARALSGMKAAALGIGVAVAGLGAALVTQGKAAFEWAANLGEAAAAAGVTVEQYQILSRAAVENGASQETMTRAIQILNRTLGQARAGVPAAVTAFRSLRIDPEQFTNAGDVLPVVMDRLRGLRTSSEQAAASQRLLGRSAADLLPFLIQGAEGYNKVAEEARKAGLVTAEQARLADEAADKLGVLAYQARTNLASALLSALPAIQSMINGLSGIATGAANAVAWLNQLGAARSRTGISTGIHGRSASGPSMLGTLGTMLQSTGPVGSMIGAALIAGSPPSRGDQLSRPDPNDPFQQWLTGRGVSAPPTGDTDLDLTSPSRGGGRSGADTERARQEALREAHQFQSDLRRHRLDLLRIQQDLVDQDQARYDIGRDIAEVEREQFVAEQTLAIQLGDLKAEQAAELLAAYDLTALAEQRRDDRQVQRDLEEERAEVAQHEYDLAADILQQEVNNATTASERRAAELRLLDLTYEHERAKLRAIEADDTAAAAARERATRELAGLEQRREGERQGVMASTRGPMEDWLSRIPQTAAEVNEALEAVAANGLQSISDGLADAIMMTRSWGDVFKNITKQIIGDLLRIQIQRGVAALIGMISPGAGKPLAYGGGKAIGGPVVPGKYYTVGERGPELFAPSSRGRIIPNNDNARGIIVNQTFAPNFAGNAATKDDMVRFAAIVKQDTISTMRDLQRRRS